MLVDLARNDLGRVCEYGTVHTPGADDGRALFPRHAHRLAGRGPAAAAVRRLRPDAGHLPGRHRQRRAEDPRHGDHRRAGGRPRGPYAGAVGYFSYDGSLDTCITIRTLVMRGPDGQRAGRRGIVADSDPEREYQETVTRRGRSCARWSWRRAGSSEWQIANRRMANERIRSATYDACVSRITHHGGHHDRRNRQLRLLHLQPGAIPGRAGRGGARLPQRCRHRRGAGRARPRATSSSRRDPATRRTRASPARSSASWAARRPVLGRLPGPPVHRRGLRRPGGARARG